MTIAVQRLSENLRPTLVAHFLALPLKDRCLRFGAGLAPAVITAYVDGIDFDHDAVFGIHDDRLELVGVAHVACEEDSAEVGLSVLPAQRRRGLGGALFHRAVAHARSRCIPRLFMHFLSGNAPIMHIAQRFGMDIVARAGIGAHANLELPPASLATIAGEFASDTFARCDRAVRALVATWQQHRHGEGKAPESSSDDGPYDGP
jgi:GNAT superfamily N-acetyltransferase